MNQSNTPLLQAVTELIETKPAYFRIPGHRLDKGVSSRWTDRVGTAIFAYDVTETPLTDDLHSPEGAIGEAQRLLGELYSADQSFFLVNGSTCGNEAMIISAAFEGEKIMIARNAHKSALMGLILSGAEPVYVMPEVIDDWAIQGEIAAEAVRKAFAENPDCRALFLVSPSYYGICSDLRAIADICHEYGALLLVDEAHGGHVYFHDRLPAGALEAGADVCVQSMHKVTGALTQSSVLHIKHHGVGESVLERIAQNLQLVQSTSPSYLLMTSLDCARYELARNGAKMMEKALHLAAYARHRICKISGFRCMEGERLDRTRLVISAGNIGLTGYALEKILFEEYAVNMELSDCENVLAIVTYANEIEDMDRLVAACAEISGRYAGRDALRREDSYPPFPQLPQQVMTPRRAYFSAAETVCWQEAAGQIAGQMIAPYPPGIPVIYPGERISQAVWDYIECFRRDGRQIHGAGPNGRLDWVKVIGTETKSCKNAIDEI
ncbi:MAG: aminotransferase class I/II-fold pyridoxal phosphate-dependent enzyme [Lachnospiraceae bacterium]|nr:aminotransferase class I/II-fold pyridoxal phosphate-dependent enzyme [Lachnospiraceae bacterium]